MHANRPTAGNNEQQGHANPMSSAAFSASNGASAISKSAPHRKNAARRSRNQSPYQQRTSQKDNPTQLLIKPVGSSELRAP
jgi:hypothetical protein